MIREAMTDQIAKTSCDAVIARRGTMPEMLMITAKILRQVLPFPLPADLTGANHLVEAIQDAQTGELTDLLLALNIMLVEAARGMDATTPYDIIAEAPPEETQ